MRLPTNEQARRERKREATRQRLYDAAMDAFRRSGFEHARVDDIVKAARVSHATFYFHFANKDEVLIEWLRALDVRLVEEVAGARAVGLYAVLDGAAAIIAAAWQGDAELLPNVALAALRAAVGAAAWHSRTDSADELGPPWSRCALVLADHFSSAILRGEIAELLPPRQMAELFLVSVSTTALAWSADPKATSLRVVLSRAVECFLDGVLAGAAVPSRQPER